MKKRRKREIVLWYTLEILCILTLIGLTAAIVWKSSVNTPKQTFWTLPLLPATATEIDHGDQSKKDIIFTFDAGDGIQSADGILAALAKHHVKGTFFMTGKFIETHPDTAREIAASNSEIFDHTFDHPHLTQVGDGHIAWELQAMSDELYTVTGLHSGPYFRPPYGDRDSRVIADAARAGYREVYWTVDARDWMEPQGETADEVENRILSTLAPGNIYLMHVGDTITAKILDDVLTKVEAAGYTPVSLTQGL